MFPLLSYLLVEGVKLFPTSESSVFWPSEIHCCWPLTNIKWYLGSCFTFLGQLYGCALKSRHAHDSHCTGFILRLSTIPYTSCSQYTWQFTESYCVRSDPGSFHTLSMVGPVPAVLALIVFVFQDRQNSLIHMFTHTFVLNPPKLNISCST